MTDKELKDAVERILGFNPADMFGDDWDTDWRVAGAVMERMTWSQLNHLLMPLRTSVGIVSPRAIIEAGVTALQERT